MSTFVIFVNFPLKQKTGVDAAFSVFHFERKAKTAAVNGPRELEFSGMEFNSCDANDH